MNDIDFGASIILWAEKFLRGEPLVRSRDNINMSKSPKDAVRDIDKHLAIKLVSWEKVHPSGMEALVVQREIGKRLCLLAQSCIGPHVVPKRISISDSDPSFKRYSAATELLGVS